MDVILFVIVIVTVIYVFSLGKAKSFFTEKTVRKPFVHAVPTSSNPVNKVTPDNTPLHIRRGWKQVGSKFKGFYRTRYGAWQGLIEPRGDIFNVFIFNPPIEKLKKHSRWVYMHHERNDKWRIDLAINPKDKDIGAIIYFVENMIIDSYQKL